MLSGNGRHRRPRQAPALIVAAGVTGSAIAIPLLGATSAGAADATTWDRLAECESGGAWSANEGDGHYGGLQLTQETWENYGGLDYAPSADQASRSQQIAVAEKILADQGPKAWPTCALLVGLSQGGAAADVDPGVSEDTSSPSSDASSGSSDEAESSTSAEPTDDSPKAAEGSEASGESETGNPDESGKSDESAQDEGDSPSDSATESPSGSAESSDSEDSGTGTGRHRGESAQEGLEDTRSSDSSGRHASRSDADRGDDGSYTVRTGDSLWAIADAHDVEGGWTALYDENKKTVGDDPDLILPGQTLDLGLESTDK
ncbi:LysM peptidoglycan-binding domain-containing protein [Streptomyces himalayensis]|uniref:LysM peptidoglycan-binding domain-containing protein n=1 Tax=Streptomyces himalayensis subsp. himalayensis TaxID=2756131 RepID=A0A7W0DRD1_9ACTN|nr:transglycosylase family protein [Streptomyces himalayensis]MBA2949871.1 LysM peptidoglycan-binding domain-containing protein [Streptomyces himalayensis subsp. himalayensis]